MLDIDEGGESAAFLRLGDDRERERRFSRRFGAKNFYDTPARKTADAQRAVDQDVAGRDDINIDDFFFAEAHDRTIAEVFGDLLNRKVEILIARRSDFVFGSFFFGFCGHNRTLYVRLDASFAK